MSGIDIESYIADITSRVSKISDDVEYEDWPMASVDCKCVNKTHIAKDYNGYPVISIDGVFHHPVETMMNHFLSKSSHLTPIRISIERTERLDEETLAAVVATSLELPGSTVGLSSASTRVFLYVQLEEGPEFDVNAKLVPNIESKDSTMHLYTMSIDKDNSEKTLENYVTIMSLEKRSDSSCTFSLQTMSRINRTNNVVMLAFQVQQLVEHYEKLDERVDEENEKVSEK